MHRYFKFFDYYLETFAKNLSGRGLMNPAQNGEYAVLEQIVKNNLDDFFYSNLLLVKDGCILPLPCKREVIPII